MQRSNKNISTKYPAQFIPRSISDYTKGMEIQTNTSEKFFALNRNAKVNENFQPNPKMTANLLQEIVMQAFDCSDHSYPRHEHPYRSVNGMQIIANIRLYELAFSAVAYLDPVKNRLVIAFKGSDKFIESWMKENYKRVTKGAPRSVTSPFIIDSLQEIINAYPELDVTFTGHSLGAIISTFFSAWFKKPAIVFDNEGINLDIDASRVTSFQTIPHLFNATLPGKRGNIIQMCPATSTMLYAGPYLGTIDHTRKNIRKSLDRFFRVLRGSSNNPTLLNYIKDNSKIQYDNDLTAALKGLIYQETAPGISPAEAGLKYYTSTEVFGSKPKKHKTTKEELSKELTEIRNEYDKFEKEIETARNNKNVEALSKIKARRAVFYKDVISKFKTKCKTKHDKKRISESECTKLEASCTFMHRGIEYSDRNIDSFVNNQQKQQVKTTLSAPTTTEINKILAPSKKNIHPTITNNQVRRPFTGDLRLLDPKHLVGLRNPLQKTPQEIEEFDAKTTLLTSSFGHGLGYSLVKDHGDDPINYIINVGIDAFKSTGTAVAMNVFQTLISDLNWYYRWSIAGVKLYSSFGLQINRYGVSDGLTRLGISFFSNTCLPSVVAGALDAAGDKQDLVFDLTQAAFIGGKDAKDETMEKMIKTLKNSPFAIINELNSNGWSALTLAASRGNLFATNTLLQHPGIDVNLKNKDSQTALMWAAINGHKQVVMALLNHPKIILDIRNNKNETALDIAKNRNWRELVSLLKIQRANNQPQRLLKLKN